MALTSDLKKYWYRILPKTSEKVSPILISILYTKSIADTIGTKYQYQYRDINNPAAQALCCYTPLLLDVSVALQWLLFYCLRDMFGPWDAAVNAAYGRFSAGCLTQSILLYLYFFILVFNLCVVFFRRINGFIYRVCQEQFNCYERQNSNNFGPITRRTVSYTHLTLPTIYSV